MGFKGFRERIFGHTPALTRACSWWTRAAAVFVAAFVALVAGPGASAQSSDLAVTGRKALVVGNGVYSGLPPVVTAGPDAADVASALQTLGFSVATHTDLDGTGMRRALREFAARLKPGDEAVFYYAGHGVQLGDTGFLLPVDVRAEDDADIRDEAIALQRVLDVLADSGARASIALIDACRKDPCLSGRGSGGAKSRGLSTASPSSGQLVVFSAGTGQSALESLGPQDQDRNSVFVRILLRQMRRTGIPVDQMFRELRTEVVSLARSAGHEQVPALYDQMSERVYFAAGAAAPAIQGSPLPMPAPDVAERAPAMPGNPTIVEAPPLPVATARPANAAVTPAPIRPPAFDVATAAVGDPPAPAKAFKVPAGWRVKISDDGEARYCRKAALTGSRFAKEECLSLEQLKQRLALEEESAEDLPKPELSVPRI
jgi:hypothetical protein